MSKSNPRKGDKRSRVGMSRLLTAKNPEQVNGSGVMIETGYAYDDASNLVTKTGPNSGG